MNNSNKQFKSRIQLKNYSKKSNEKFRSKIQMKNSSEKIK